MYLLNYEDIDITGFAGIRERILVMDESVFGRRKTDESWSGFGSLVYLAHAIYRPYGSTGMHHHEKVNILSIMTRGRIVHEGSLGKPCISL